MLTQATKLQNRVIEDTESSLENGKDALIDSPTGSGKSRMFSKISENGMEKGERTLIISGRINLAKQALKNISKWCDKPIKTSLGVDGDFDQSGDVVSTTVQTANLYLNEIGKYDRLVIDEAHHAKEENSDYNNLVEALQKKNPEVKIVAASATFPDDMKGMIPRLKKADRHVITFDEAISAKLIDLPKTKTPEIYLKNNKTIKEMVFEAQKKGHGSKAESIGSAIRKQLPDDWMEIQAWHYSKEMSERQTISYFDSVKEAEAFKKELKEFGIDVETVHSGRKNKENEKAFADFESGAIKGLVSVDMISEGTDVDARGIFIGKITTSETEYRQINGRATRSYGATKEEKSLVYDMGASTHMHGEMNAQASINNIAKNIESTSRQTMDLRPGSKDARAIWRKIAGTEAYAAPIDNTIVYAVKKDDEYIAVQSLKDRKGARIQLLTIDGEKKGRPRGDAFHKWSEEAIRKSEKSIARLMSQNGGLDALIAADWQKNGSSVQRNIEMMSMPMAVPQQMGMGR